MLCLRLKLNNVGEEKWLVLRGDALRVVVRLSLLACTAYINEYEPRSPKCFWEGGADVLG